MAIVEICKNLIGYFNFILIAIIAPTNKPTDSAAITMDQDLAPSKCSKAISGPKIFSAAAQHITINENEITTITIHLNEINTRQPWIRSSIMVLLDAGNFGVKWRMVKTITPDSKNVAASIPKVIAAPYRSIKNPAEAAPNTKHYLS